MTQTLFISDLHLTASEPATVELFLHFMQNIPEDTEALYVLGDLFEQWIGDDDIDTPFSRAIVDAFARVAQSGVDVFFMHGNRDFLLGQTFCDACQGTLLNDPSQVELYK